MDFTKKRGTADAVVPYGAVLFSRLVAERNVSTSGLAVSLLAAVLLTVPFILVMHAAGDYARRVALRWLVER